MSSGEGSRRFSSFFKEPEATREKYGLNRFGQSCLLARRLIEAGVRFVTINMFETVFERNHVGHPRLEAVLADFLLPRS